MKKILVPIDFSKESLNAFDTAVSLAKVTHSSIVLLHIVEDPNVQTMKIMGEDHYDTMENLYVKLLIEKVKEKFEIIVNDPAYSLLDLSYKIEVGNVFENIAKNIASQKCSLIFMGSKGASGLRELLVGSIADKTVRYANCPVIVIKGESDLTHIKNIVFATDLKDDQAQIMDELLKMQTFFKAKLHVIKIYDSEWTEETEVLNRVNAFVKHFDVENYTVSVKKSTDMAGEIMNFAESVDADVVAFGSHDRHGLLQLIAGHVSKSLVNHEYRPVWTQSIK